MTFRNIISFKGDMGQLDTIAMPQTLEDQPERLEDPLERLDSVPEDALEADFPALFDIIEMESNMNKIQAQESYVNDASR